MIQTIGARLKYLRKDILGISQTELGELLSLSKSGISLIESDNRTLTTKNIQIICCTYNVSSEWLQTGEGTIFNDDTSATPLPDYSFTKRILNYAKRLSTLSNSDLDFLDIYLGSTADVKKEIQKYTTKINDSK